jgi:protein TonB
MARKQRTGSIYVASIVLHAGVAWAVVGIERPELHEATTVTVREVEREKAKKVDAPSPVQAPKLVRKLSRPAAPPKVAPPLPAPAPAAEASASPKVADFGLSMSGSVRAGGIGIPLGGSTRAAPRELRSAPPKALLPSKAKPAHGEDACIEALIKPKPISTPQPAYADRAREAGIQGKVRVELTVDDSGAVVSARVLESLGYGLDEAALEAAKTWRFEPATRCGKSTATTFVVGIRFTL